MRHRSPVVETTGYNGTKSAFADSRFKARRAPPNFNSENYFRAPHS